MGAIRYTHIDEQEDEQEQKANRFQTILNSLQMVPNNSINRFRIHVQVAQVMTVRMVLSKLTEIRMPQPTGAECVCCQLHSSQSLCKSFPSSNPGTTTTALHPELPTCCKSVRHQRPEWYLPNSKYNSPCLHQQPVSSKYPSESHAPVCVHQSEWVRSVWCQSLSCRPVCCRTVCSGTGPQSYESESECSRSARIPYQHTIALTQIGPALCNQ